MESELERHIEERIIPRYDGFDRAHGRDHVRTVIARSLELARGYDLDEEMVYVVAAFHDTGLVCGRERHHLESGRILAGDAVIRRRFTLEQIAVMREAVEDHRASSDHPPRSIYGRIVAEADRLIDAATIVRRTIQYGLDRYPELDREGHYLRSRDHLANKYGDGGYLRLWIPESENGRRLEALRAEIRDEAVLRARFDAIFDEESRE